MKIEDIRKLEESLTDEQKAEARKRWEELTSLRSRKLWQKKKKRSERLANQYYKTHYEEIMSKRHARKRVWEFSDRQIVGDWMTFSPEEAYVWQLNKELRASYKRAKNNVRCRVTSFKLCQMMKMELNKRIYFYQHPEKLMEKKKILCILGESGVGKTLASLHLRYKLNANVICSFTTRKPRPTEENGRDHYFIDIVPPIDEILAITDYGNSKYYALKSQVYGPCTVYVIDEAGLLDLLENNRDEYDITTVYITRTRRLRLKTHIKPARMERDKKRVTLDLGFYNYVIENNSTKGELFKSIEEIYNTVKEKRV